MAYLSSLQDWQARYLPGYAALTILSVTRFCGSLDADHQPVGYRYERVAGHGKLLVPDEPTASILRKALEHFADGRLQTQVEVARFLEKYPQVPLVRGGKVHLQRIRKIMEKPVYAGYIDIPRWGLSLVKAKHEPLISFDAFQKIQERLNGRAHAPTRKTDTDDFLLRGSVACGECGHAMTGAFSKGRARHYGYYFCQQKGCSAHRKNIRKEDIEERFRHLLARLTPAPRMLSLFRELLGEAWDRRESVSANEAKEFKAALAAQERKIERLMERLVGTDDSGPTAAYEGQLRKLQTEKHLIAEKLEYSSVSIGDFEKSYRTAFEFLANPCILWDSGDAASRKLVLKLAFTGLIPYHRNGGYRTVPTSCIFEVLQGSNDNKFGMVPRGGTT